MKRIGLLVFALLAISIATLVVLMLTLPTAKATIQAIRPTGKFFTHTNGNGTILTVQSWSLALPTSAEDEPTGLRIFKRSF